MANLNALPAEILAQILLLVEECSRSSLCDVALSSKRLNTVATPILYRELAISTQYEDKIPIKIETLYHHPAELLSFARSIVIGMGRIRGGYCGKPFWYRAAYLRSGRWTFDDEPCMSLASLPPEWGAQLRVSNIVWSSPASSRTINNQWLTKFITMNASTLTSLKMTMSPKNNDLDINLWISKMPKNCLPNLREFVAYGPREPHGFVQTYYILNAACSLREFTIFAGIDDSTAAGAWPWGIGRIPKGPEYPEMDGVVTLEDFFQLCIFSPLEKTRLQTLCLSRMPILTAKMAELLDTIRLKDLRMSLCGNTTLFLSSLKGNLNLQTFIVNDDSGDPAGINKFLLTLPPGLRLLAYQVEVGPRNGSFAGIGNPYNGSEFPFDSDVITRHKDTLRCLAHTVTDKDGVNFQPPEQADSYFETRTSAYEDLNLIELSIPIKMAPKRESRAAVNVHLPKSFARLKHLRVLNLVPSWSDYRDVLLWRIARTNIRRGEVPTSYAAEAYSTLYSIAQKAARLHVSSESRDHNKPPTLEWIIFGCIANTDRHFEHTLTFRIKWHWHPPPDPIGGFYPEIIYVPYINEILREEGSSIQLGKTFMDSMYNYMDEPHRWRSGS
ncbi:hypothetical protein TWF281_011133 [Arthrobotrys megalospora]